MKNRKNQNFRTMVNPLNLEDKEKTKIRKIKNFKIFKIWKIKNFKIFARGAWPPVLKTRKTKILITLFSRLWNPCSTRSKHGNRCHGHKKTQSDGWLKDTISWWSSSWSFCKQPAVLFGNPFTFYLTTYFRIWKPLWIPTMDFGFYPCWIQCKYPWWYSMLRCKYLRYFTLRCKYPLSSSVNTLDSIPRV